MDREASTSHNVLESMLLDESAEPKQLPLSLLEDITNRFSPDHEIGSGGFAVVYKGIVGKSMVAVKKISITYGIHEKNFMEEINCLIQAKHKNIVRFLGYCVDSQGLVKKYEGKHVMAEQLNWLLCFEYAHNGSLDRHINDASLNWRERYRIIKGICEGLPFLHQKNIIHLDMKPGNILLDAHMVPKITDFGVSRHLGKDQTHAITQNIFETRGYTDPRYVNTGEMALTTDIYSLGVIIMEILIGVRRYPGDESLIESWIKQLEASHGDMVLEQVRVCIKIGMECMRVDPKERPVAQEIVDRLNKMPSAEYPGETVNNSSLVELQVSLPRDQLGERIEKLAAESLQKADVKEHSEILENVAERLGRLHSEECQQEADHISSWGAQDAKQKVNRRGSSISRSISTMFSKLNILDILNRKAYRNSDRNSMRALERSHIIKIFKKGELKPILKSSNLIGKGFFGEVYKGLLDNDVVAVKKPISGDVMETEQFRNEVIIQSQVVHKNIVRLIGCCLEMDNHALVYEFLTKGSLDDILHNDNKVPLSLDVRLAIVTGSANGLSYLHSQARTIIFHGDVKPANILLDDNFMPKISDFGLSRLIAGDKEHSLYIIGDVTYMDPVYRERGRLTEKSDVYSFGIVILEVISRKKATHYDSNMLLESFLEVHKERKKATDLFDKEIAVTTGDLEILDSLAEIAVECFNHDVDRRPTMTDIAERLLILNRSRRLQAV